MKELTKRGFIRKKEQDFRDDGNKFKVYYYKKLRITYLKDENDYFLSIRIPEGNYIYEDYKDKDWYKLADEFNYCQSIDPDKVIQNCETILNGIKELEEENAKRDPVDIDLLNIVRNQEIEMAEEVINKFKSGNYIWTLDSEYQIKQYIDYVKSLEKQIRFLKEEEYSELEEKELRQIEARINNWGYIDISKDDYYIEQLNKYMEVQ